MDSVAHLGPGIRTKPCVDPDTERPHAEQELLPVTSPKPLWSLGVVSFLNARPLIAGLEQDPSFDLRFDVPSRLAGLLDEGSVDAALVPVIDLFKPGRDWHVISDACIGCDGETFTVRVFSRMAPAKITTLYVDGDSHTSVVLAQILWRELYRRELTILPLEATMPLSECDAVLLIGDKVIHHPYRELEIETDLGSAWKSLTTLPFVFAAWAASGDTTADLRALAKRLSSARDAGVASAEMIAADFGPGLGWPVALAKRYLTKRLRFDLGPKQREGMATFLELAKRHGLIEPTKELSYA